MKRHINLIIPYWLISLHKKINKKDQKFKNISTKEVFTEIYNKNIWTSVESISGTGSEVNQTSKLIKELEILMNELNISSVLDIPCGDLNWIQKINFKNIEYIGADIVEKLICENKERFRGKNNFKFEVLNLIGDPLPKTDLIIIRDCLVHLSYKDIFNAIENIKSSGCKYLLTTTFTNHYLNSDIITGNWRTINLQESPFNLPSPRLIINENCTTDNGKYIDKSMALWEINKL